MRPSIFQLPPNELESALATVGAAAAHAGRIRRTLLAGHTLADSPGISPRIVAALLERFDELSCVSTERVEAPDGSTKHLIRLADGRFIEAVALPGFALAPFAPGEERVIERANVAPSACLSSQVGCAMACRFCASGLAGVERNLAAHELIEQVALLRRYQPVRRLVFMGSGEPTQNLAALGEALEVFRNEGDLGPRNVLVSTVGPPSAIDRLTAMGRKFTLAVSLHSATLAGRASLIPTQKRVDPAELLAAADRFRTATSRAYQVEYVLLGGENDSDADAVALAGLMRDRRALLSLIRWNAVAGTGFETPELAQTYRFLQILHDAGISARLRRTVGTESTAACGQLRGAQSTATARVS